MAMAPIQLLAQECPYTAGVAIKRNKKKRGGGGETESLLDCILWLISTDERKTKNALKVHFLRFSMKW